MLALVMYDISSNKSRARLHRALKEFGLNTQKSIFECEVDWDTLEKLTALGEMWIDPETDSFRIYRICERCRRKVAVSGLGIKLVQLDFQVI